MKYLFTFLLISYTIICFSKDLIFFHTNDLHGTIFSYDYDDYEVAGISERAYIIKNIRSRFYSTILLDAGDINTGQFHSNHFNAEPDILVMNYLEYDALTCGNHEFYYGIDHLKEQVKIATFPFLSANITDLEGNYIVSPYIIKNMPNGLKVAVLGLTTTNSFSSDDLKTIICHDEVKNEKKIVPELKQKADIIIALTHLGVLSPLPIGAARLALEVPEIDLIIDGHSHTIMKDPYIVNGVPIVQVGDRGKYLGKGTLSFDEVNKKTELKAWEAIPLMRKENEYHFTKDKTISDLLQTYLDKLDKDLTKPIAFLNENLPINNIRNSSTELGKFVCDAVLKTTTEFSPQFALLNSGGIRASFVRGEINSINISSVYPFENQIVIVKISGNKIIEALYKSLKENYNTGGFLQFSSNVVYDDKSLIINGNEINPDSVYTVATCSYLTSGGDNYSEFQTDDVIEIDITVDKSIKSYLMQYYPLK
jgi:5'-nucleotidase/UDP-sugar diphosphatase